MKPTSNGFPAHPSTGFLSGLACWLAPLLAVGIDCLPLRADENAAAPVTVVGRITNEQGNPLAETLVRVATPEVDMRFVYPGSGHRVVETKTDEQGRYEVKVPLNGATSLAVDAMKRGYRSAAGTFMSGGEPRSGSVKPGETFEASFVLPKSLYVAGTVVDEPGHPISGAIVFAGLSLGRGTGGIARTKTDAQGKFEVFNFPAEPEPGSRGNLTVRHDQFMDGRLSNIYGLDAEKQTGLRITLFPGRKISGRVVDAAGQPVAGAMVEAVVSVGFSPRRATLTDADGRFKLSGLIPTQSTILVHALPIRQRVKKTFTMELKDLDVELRLELMELAEPADVIELFGMKLATITPEVRAAYLLPSHSQGAIILDPGQQSARLEIGGLHEGDYFILVGDGNTELKSLSKFVSSLRSQIARAKDGPPYEIRVVYVFARVDMSGTNTQYIKLTADDLRQLDAATDELRRRPNLPVPKQDER